MRTLSRLYYRARYAVTGWRRSPLGVQFTTAWSGDDLHQPQGHGAYHWLDALQPACIVVNNNVEVAARIANERPGMTVFIRVHARADGANTDDDQHRHETAAQTVARMVSKRDDYGVPNSVWWCFNNEPLPVDVADWQRVADHAIQVYQQAAAHGLRVAGPHFGVKSIPQDDAVWQALAPMFAAAVQYGAIVGLHPYSPGPSVERVIPTPQGDWHITAAWWTEEIERIVSLAPGIRLLLSEIGSEPIAGIPGAGTWRDLRLTGAEYAGQLAWLWDTVFAPLAGNIVGTCVFSFDEDGDPESSRWNAWDIRGSDGVRDTLAAWVPVCGVASLPGQGGDEGDSSDGEQDDEVPEPLIWRKVLQALAALLRRWADWCEAAAT